MLPHNVEHTLLLYYNGLETSSFWINFPLEIVFETRGECQDLLESRFESKELIGRKYVFYIKLPMTGLAKHFINQEVP